MAMPPVSASRSPGRAPAGVIRSARLTSPSMVPQTMGRGSPAVTSVWPPTMLAPTSAQAAWAWAKMASASSAVAAPSGSSRVARNQRGAAPAVARSLALTWTAYQPISSVGEGDGVRLGHQQPVAQVDDRAIAAHAGAQHQPRVARPVAVQQAGQQVRRQLAFAAP